MRLIPIAWLALAGVALAEDYQVRPAPDSRLALTVEKTGLYRGKKHLFLFERYQGSLQYDPAKPTEARMQLTIESAGAVCKDDWVSAKDLKSVEEEAFNNMLAVKRYPTIAFTSTAIKDLGGGKFEAQGTLTIRDIPKPVTIAVQMSPAGAQLRLEGSAKIKLTDYKLKPPSAALGLIGTKDEMTLNFIIHTL